MGMTMSTSNGTSNGTSTGTSPTMMLAMTTVPDRACGERIARALVDERIAACVSLLGPATSIYRWQGEVDMAEEVPLLIKTGADRLPRLRQRLLELHPCELPELVALPVTDGLPDYIAWVLAESRPLRPER